MSKDRRSNITSAFIGAAISAVLTLISGMVLFQYQQKNAAPTRIVLENLAEVINELKETNPDELSAALEEAGVVLSDETPIENKNEQTDTQSKAFDMSTKVSAYQSNNLYVYTENTNASFFMAGVEYRKGFVFRPGYDQSYAYFNLDGSFAKIVGTLGVVDGAKMSNGVLLVYYDGELVQEILIEADKLPEQVTLDVRGVLQLKLAFAEKGLGSYSYGFGNATIE